MTAAGNESLVRVDHPDAMAPGPERRTSAVADGKPARTAFERWLEEMRPRLVRLGMRLLWNVHDAEEVAQDALLTAYQQLDRLRDPARRNAWLYRITINLAHNRARRRQVRSLSSEAETAVLTSDAATGDASGSLPARVRQAIAQLPGRQQAALVLREMEGLAYDEIAAILDVRAAAARLLVHRARESVREIVVRRWPESLEQ